MQLHIAADQWHHGIPTADRGGAWQADRDRETAAERQKATQELNQRLAAQARPEFCAASVVDHCE